MCSDSEGVVVPCDALTLAGFDLVEAKAKHRRDLSHIQQLLNDANDAFEINEDEVGLRRIKRALAFIEQSKPIIAA